MTLKQQIDFLEGWSDFYKRSLKEDQKIGLHDGRLGKALKLTTERSLNGIQGVLESVRRLQAVEAVHSEWFERLTGGTYPWGDADLNTVLLEFHNAIRGENK